jgi:iron-sulfur cluster repair protein YtfE (RIC family)
MKISELLNETRIYKQCENEIREWVEKSWEGLSIDFYPNNIEVVRTREDVDFDKERVAKIVEAVNIKIGEILESHQEEIYLAERVERIHKNHPRFKNYAVESIDALKKNKKFLKYLKELIIKVPKVAQKESAVNV